MAICQYCNKYGSKGALVFLEKQFIDKPKPRESEYIDIHKAQLSVFHHLNKDNIKNSSDKETSHNIVQKKV